MAASSIQLRPKDYNVVERCSRLVLEHQLKDVLDIVHLPENADVVKRECWELTKAVAGAFSTVDATQQNFSDYTLLEAILKGIAMPGVMEIAEAGSEKEMAYALLDQTKKLPSSDDAFSASLRALAHVLARVLPKQRTGMDNIRKALCGRVAAAELPEAYALQESEDKGELALPEGAEVLAAPLLRHVSDLTDFVEMLLPVVSRTGPDALENGSSRRELSLLLAHLLGHPMATLRCEGTADACCARLMGLLSTLQPDFSRYWEDLMAVAVPPGGDYADGAAGQDDDIAREHRKRDVERLPLRSVGNFAYLVLVRGHSRRSFPAVFEKQYVLELVLHPACALLESSNAVEMEKGLLLLESLLGDVAFLPELFLEHGGFLELLQATTHYSTMSSVADFRRRFQRLLLSLVGKFSSRSRFALLSRLLRTTQSDVSMNAHVTKLLKDQVHAHCCTGDEYFDGRRLDTLLDEAFRLPSGATTDLMAQYERIAATLNLATYLLLQRQRTRSSEQPRGCRATATLKASFLWPLDKCLTASLRLHSVKLAALRGGHERPPGSPEEAQVSIGAEKLPLPAITAEMQIKFLEAELIQMKLLEATLRWALKLAG